MKEQKFLLKEMEEEKMQLISIIDNSTDGLMVFEENKLIYVSPKLSQITEYTEKEIEKSGDGNFLIAEDEIENVARIIEEREKTKKRVSTYPSKLKTKTGKIVPVEVTTTNFKRGGKNYMNVSFRDMSRANEAIEKLENLYSNQAKFFSEIAHSLKTPFTVIYGLLELQENANDNGDSTQDTFKLIKEELDLVNKKISDLLKISKMEILDYPINTQSIPIDEFLDAFYVKAKSLGYKYCDKNHNYNCSCFSFKKAITGIKIQADIEVLMDILMTLAENAYIHSPKRNLKPDILLKTNLHTNAIDIVLEDHGKGISQTEQEKLFKPFSKQLFKSTGHGIGLPMCKKMVRKMNGDIKVNSKRGVGSVFTITFPIAK